MNVLVDTCVWFLALRRAPGRLSARECLVVGEWTKLIREGRVVLAGPVRQEVLSGIRDEDSFEKLRRHLAAYEDVPLATEDYEEAARFFNRCRAKGVTGTPIDLVLCSLASRLRLAIFTTDADFRRYARLLPIRLHKPRKAKA